MLCSSYKLPPEPSTIRKEFYMKQNNDFYDSLSQINKQIDLLKSISQTLAAGLYDQQQDLVLAALNLTTLENTKFAHKLGRSLVNSLPASINSSCALLNSWYNATTIDLSKVLPASAIEVARNVASFSTLQSGFSPSSLGFEAINAAINSMRILLQQILDRYAEIISYFVSAKYSTGTSKYFARIRSLSNFGA